jgi:hypothetical protein
MTGLDPVQHIARLHTMTPSPSDSAVWNRIFQEAETTAHPTFRLEDLHRFLGAILIFTMPSEGVVEAVDQLREMHHHYWESIATRPQLADLAPTTFPVDLRPPTRSTPFQIDLGS